MKRHYARYTLKTVSDITGCPQDKLEVVYKLRLTVIKLQIELRTNFISDNLTFQLHFETKENESVGKEKD